MPTITNNTSLGNAFGGKIATLNYNYQPNTEPSSATLTIISENEEYVEPSLLQEFVIPKLNIPMVITEIQYNDDSNTTTLQIELQDRTSLILDRNLILIKGIHSSGIGENQISGKYNFYPTFSHPSFKLGSQFSLSKESVKKFANGVIIGRLRSTYVARIATIQPDPESVTPLGLQNVTIDNLSTVNTELTTADETATTDIQNAIKNCQKIESNDTWGFTMNDLVDGITALGLTINGIPKKTDPLYKAGDKKYIDLYKKYDTFLFTDSGTARSVLSSVLSKFGLSFYIHPINGSINIIDNSKLLNINNRIKEIYDNKIPLNGATSLTKRKTVRGVTARHLILKGTFQNTGESNSGAGGAGGSGGSGTGSPAGAENSSGSADSVVTRNKTFHRVKFTEYLDDQEVQFISKIAALIGMGISDTALHTYIISLGQIENSTNWSSQGDKAVYGGTKSDGSTDLDPGVFKQRQLEEDKKEPWQLAFEKDSPKNFKGNPVGVRTAVRTQKETK